VGVPVGGGGFVVCLYMSTKRSKSMEVSVEVHDCCCQYFQIKKRVHKESRVQCNNSLGRLLRRAVRVEGLKLLLDSRQRVGELLVVQHDDGLLDPRQQVRRQRLVLSDHLLCLDGVIQNLKRERNERGGVKHLFIFILWKQTCHRSRLTFPTLLPSTASCFILEK